MNTSYVPSEFKDQSLCGPYIVEDRPRESHYAVRAFKIRTSGHMTVAKFPYRTTDSPMYHPMKGQAFVLASIMCAQFNRLGLTVKDQRKWVDKIR